MIDQFTTDHWIGLWGNTRRASIPLYPDALDQLAARHTKDIAVLFAGPENSKQDCEQPG